jgi:DNA-binding MarR family transcriptional regulator
MRAIVAAEPLHRLMQHVVRDATAGLHAVLRASGLSLPQLGTLHFLGAEGAQSVSAIAHHLHLSLAATSHLVERLVRRGLLTRREDPGDRRQKLVDLADAGVVLVGGVQAEAVAAIDALLADVPTDLRRRLDADLREVLAAFDRPPAPAGPAADGSEP